jgi:hypothetical protein
MGSKSPITFLTPPFSPKKSSPWTRLARDDPEPGPTKRVEGSKTPGPPSNHSAKLRRI